MAPVRVLSRLCAAAAAATPRGSNTREEEEQQQQQQRQRRDGGGTAAAAAAVVVVATVGRAAQIRVRRYMASNDTTACAQWTVCSSSRKRQQK
eukprot:COSAG01_NODE_4502_length_4970_cov_587.236707_2_plen_93_part_00